MGIEMIGAVNDEAAVSAARKLLNDRDLEIWTGSRHVGALQASSM